MNFYYKKTPQHALTKLLILAFIISLSACSTTANIQTRHNQYSPGTIEYIRTSLGHVGVVSGEFTPEFYGKNNFPFITRLVIAGGLIALGSHLHSRANEVTGPYLQGLEKGIGYEMLSLGSYITALVALFYYPEAGLPAQRRKTVKTAIASTNLHHRIRQELVSTLSNNNIPATLLAGIGPKNSDSESDYSHLSAKGIDSILEIGVVQTGLIPVDGNNVEHEFFVTLRARLISTRDNQVIYDNLYTHRSSDVSSSIPVQQPRKYVVTLWTDEDARLVKDEINYAITMLTDKVTAVITATQNIKPGN